jgi:hypothetical protein
VKCTVIAAERAAERRQQRFVAFESALELGLTVRQALDEAGWTPSAAVRSYQRYGVSVPDALRGAHRQHLDGTWSRIVCPVCHRHITLSTKGLLNPHADKAGYTCGMSGREAS